MASRRCWPKNPSMRTASRASATTAAASWGISKRPWNTACATRSWARAFPNISKRSSRAANLAPERASVHYRVGTACLYRNGRLLYGIDYGPVPAARIDLEAYDIRVLAAHALEPHASDGSFGDAPLDSRCETQPDAVAGSARVARV